MTKLCHLQNQREAKELINNIKNFKPKSKAGLIMGSNCFLMCSRTSTCPCGKSPMKSHMKLDSKCKFTARKAFFELSDNFSVKYSYFLKLSRCSKDQSPEISQISRKNRNNDFRKTFFDK